MAYTCCPFIKTHFRGCSAQWLRPCAAPADHVGLLPASMLGNSQLPIPLASKDPMPVAPVSTWTHKQIHSHTHD